MQLLTLTVEHMTNQQTEVNLRRHAKPTRLNDSQQDQYVKLPLEAIISKLTDGTFAICHADTCENRVYFLC